MKNPEDVKIEFTREWVRKAENDLTTAEHLFKGGNLYAYAITFHAQQAVEKFLKAFLVWHQIEFRKTHDIQELLDLVSDVDVNLPESIAESANLTPYGVEYRYPGDYPDATMKDAAKALEVVRHVRDEIRYRLPEVVLSDENL
ncbi:MAG: HEPN domain-containing protein [Deltaproteobacteria bacterium]|nr:HEPN domain-containing protein [Deltaproteobacteria bacterium]